MFTLTIESDYHAFEVNPCQEIARILRELADGIGDESWQGRRTQSGMLRDMKGNRVGAWQYQGQ